MIMPREEWIKMKKKQQDAMKAKNKARHKCEYCYKPGHTESGCRTLMNVVAELKKENTKKSVAYTTAVPAEAEEDDKRSFKAVYVPKQSYKTSTTLCAKISYFVTTVHRTFLTNLRPSGTITFTGIGGSIDVTQQGDFGVFGTVAYDERATSNLISVDSPKSSKSSVYDHAARCHTINTQDNIIEFKVPYGQKGLQVRRFPHVNQSHHTRV